MSFSRRFSGDSLISQGADYSENNRQSTQRTTACFSKLNSPQFTRVALNNLRKNPLCVSASSSICNSDDSGIERTMNLRSSPSPMPDSDDSNSLDGFQLSSGRSTEENFGPSGNIPFRSPEAPRRVSRPSTSLSYEYRCTEGKGDNRFHILSYEQVSRLAEMLTEVIPIHSRRAGFPTVWVRLREFFTVVTENLHAVGIPVKGIKLNGGAASHIIAMDSTPTYNDIDILILVDLSSDSSTIQRVKAAVLDALMKFVPKLLQPSSTDLPRPQEEQSPLVLEIPDTENAASVHSPNGSTIEKNEHSVLAIATPQIDLAYFSESGGSPASTSLPPDSPGPFSGYRLGHNSETCSSALSVDSASYSSKSPTSSIPSYGSDIQLRESYIYKQFRKYSTHETDCWSLISLGMPSLRSKVVELKFVDRMRRQFEFTVDSFQIHIDSMLKFLEHNDMKALDVNFYPTVVAESVAGSYADALHHLTNKLILTREPEMIRGGGLLKYCRLLVNGYQAPEGMDVCSLERYMSSRFFIDFQDVESQRAKIEAFLANHFIETEYESKILFLQTVHRVVSGSSICLMSFERYQTLYLIGELITRLSERIHPKAIPVSMDSLANQQNLVIDRIYLGDQLFPVMSPQPLYQPPQENGYYSLQSDEDTKVHEAQVSPAEPIGFVPNECPVSVNVVESIPVLS